MTTPNPLEAWLHSSNPCPTWCDQAQNPAGHHYGHDMPLDDDGRDFDRTHSRVLADLGPYGFGALTLEQQESTTDPGATSPGARRLYPPSVWTNPSSGVAEMSGALPDLAAQLRQAAAALLNAADHLDHLDQADGAEQADGSPRR